MNSLHLIVVFINHNLYIKVKTFLGIISIKEVNLRKVSAPIILF